MTLTAYREALARTARVQKSGKGAPAYSRYVNRALGRRAAALAYVFGLTPNQVTAVSAVLTFSGIAVLAVAPPTVGVGVLVSALLLLGYALDSADGQLARLRGGGSPAGEWLDHVVDAAKEHSLHAAVAICMYRYFQLPSDALLLIPLAFGGVAIVLFASFLLTGLLSRQSPQATSVGPNLPASWVVSVLKLPFDYGVLCLVFLFLGWPVGFLVCYAALLLCSVLYLPLTLATSYRTLSAIRAAAPL